jgi:DHA1 family chloramphenicol resistance protein-like MFS transporter
MPFAVYLLGLCIFAQGTSEFLLSGLLPTIAADLRISLPVAGTLVSAFALGMLVGAPTLAVLTLRWPRRTTLLACQAVFVVAHVLGALAPGYWALLVVRVVSAVAYAGFWAVASVAAISLVTPDRTARAISVVVGGLSLATIVGVPAGTVLGDHAGWRAAFWAVAALTTLSAVAVAVALPPGRPTDQPAPVLRAELRALAVPRLWVAYGTTALTTAATIVSFSYLGALLAEVSRIAVAWVPGVLALFGAGAFAGLSIGGRSSDRYPHRTLYLGSAGVVVTSVLLAVLAQHPAVIATLVFFLGLFGFVTNPAVNARVFDIAAGAPTLAGATNVSAFNVGITVAPLVGGLSIGLGFGLASVGWVGAAFGVAALASTLADSRLHRAATRRPAAQGAPAPCPAARA